MMTAIPQLDELHVVPKRRAERRLIGLALSHWDASGHCPLPRHFESASGWGPVRESNLYVVKVGTDEAQDHIIRAGATVIEALGRDPTGSRAIDILPSATNHRLSFCRTVITTKMPIADVGHFTNLRGEDIYYRSILLPLTQDADTVAYVLGVFSFKRAQ